VAGALFEAARALAVASKLTKVFVMPAIRARWKLRWALLVAGIALWPQAGWAAIKLYMKDGTYQLVKSYEVVGDRVRFYSLERSDWEEAPKSLVDFEATERAQQKQQAEDEKALEEAREIDKEHFERPLNTGFEIAPGIRLPQDEGVFAFDGKRVIRMVQTPAQMVTDKKRAALILAMPGPLVKRRSLVVLPGRTAAIRIAMAQPTFYVQLEDSSAASFALVPVKSGKEARVVEKVQAGLGVGQSGEVREALPLERAQIAPGLFKLKPSQPLALGEYALAELIREKLNLDVWDFGIEGTEGRPASGGDQPPVIRRSSSPPQN